MYKRQLLVLEARFEKDFEKPKLWPLSRSRPAMVVFETRETTWGHSAEVYEHNTCPTCPAHSSTAVLETQLSWCEYPKNLGEKIGAIRTFCGAPGGSAVLSSTAHTPLRCHSRKSPSTELRAGCVTRHALLCAVRAASCVYTRTAQGFTSRLYRREVLYCLVR